MPARRQIAHRRNGIGMSDDVGDDARPSPARCWANSRCEQARSSAVTAANNTDAARLVFVCAARGHLQHDCDTDSCVPPCRLIALTAERADMSRCGATTSRAEVRVRPGSRPSRFVLSVRRRPVVSDTQQPGGEACGSRLGGILISAKPSRHFSNSARRLVVEANRNFARESALRFGRRVEPAHCGVQAIAPRSPGTRSRRRRSDGDCADGARSRASSTLPFHE